MELDNQIYTHYSPYLVFISLTLKVKTKTREFTLL